MKNLITKLSLLIFLSILFKYSSGQINVWGIKEPHGTEKMLFERHFERLKKSKVYFAVPSGLIDKEDEDVFKEVFEKKWEFTKIEIIKEKDIEKYYQDEYAAFFTLGVEFWDNSFGNVNFQLWQREKMDNDNKNTFATFKLEINHELECELHKTRAKKINEVLQDKLLIENFKPGIIGEYLHSISNLLFKTIGKEKHLKTNDISELSEDTLYILKDFFITKSYSNLNCSIKEYEIDKAMENYPYPYKIIDNQELNYLFLSNRKFFYLKNHYYINIYCNIGSDVFYENNPKNPDVGIKKIVKAIEKSLKKK